MSDQRTSVEGSGLPKQWGRMVEDLAIRYRGGISKLELAKGHPRVKTHFYLFLDQLAAEHRAMLLLKARPTWKTIQLGTNEAITRLLYPNMEAGVRVCDEARYLAQKTVISSKRTEVNLVKVKVSELAFPKGGIREDVYNRAQSKGFGLGLSPAEVGLQLRLAYMDQPKGECVQIGMMPIEGRGMNLYVFKLERDFRDIHLCITKGVLDYFLDPEVELVFVRK